MTAILKYNLKQITDIACTGFHFEMSDDTYHMINYLSTQVGSTGLTTPVFCKSERENLDSALKDPNNSFSAGSSILNKNKKKKGNKIMEVSSEEWETIRSFQPTKIEHKSGVDGDIDQIRMFLNKLTDKTFLDMREKIIEKIDKICSESTIEDNSLKVGNIIYDLCSTNKFYSKVFADLFAELVTQYKWMMPIFLHKYSNIMEQYSDIRYIDSEKDYDGFCDMNKKNEKRRSVTSFLMNLANNGFIKKEGVVKLLKQLLDIVCNIIDTPEKKNEVDELTENIAILFNKDMIEEVEEDISDSEELYINGQTIVEIVNHLAKSKAKDHPSLSTKAIFKFMDLIDM
jgi:hypothetical protein